MDGSGSRIGPNAVTRLAEAADDRLGHAACERLFQEAGLACHRARPPETMVDEADVMALHRTLARLHPAQAGAVAADAGVRTARYLLAHRIPRPVQAVLRVLPPGLAARVLLAAIGRHAWTFAGSGRFSARMGGGVTIRIEGGPFADTLAAGPLMAFYRAVFAHLFNTLVSPRTQVADAGVDGMICQFRMTWNRVPLLGAASGGPALG
jgi:divinyl protochlorophyllide a 8-vinyl-reductase